MTNAEKLARLNSFRAAAGLDPINSWKAARHDSQLNAYDEATRLEEARENARILAEKATVTPAVKPAPEKVAKPITKKSRVLDLLTAKGGTTITAIAASLAIGDTAARSLIGDLRRDGATITATKGKDGIVVYTA